jgi:hypothetical protein
MLEQEIIIKINLKDERGGFFLNEYNIDMALKKFKYKGIIFEIEELKNIIKWGNNEEKNLKEYEEERFISYRQMWKRLKEKMRENVIWGNKNIIDFFNRIIEEVEEEFKINE